MPALWNSEGTFVSVSQFLWLVLCFPFQSVSGPSVTPRKKGKKKREGSWEERGFKKKRKKKKKR